MNIIRLNIQKRLDILNDLTVVLVVPNSENKKNAQQ